MVRELEPDALWVIDDTGFPKQGVHFSRRGATVLWDLGQNRELSGRGEPA